MEIYTGDVTYKSIIDWFYEALSEEEQAFFDNADIEKDAFPIAQKQFFEYYDKIDGGVFLFQEIYSSKTDYYPKVERGDIPESKVTGAIVLQKEYEELEQSAEVIRDNDRRDWISLKVGYPYNKVFEKWKETLPDERQKSVVEKVFLDYFLDRTEIERKFLIDELDEEFSGINIRNTIILDRNKYIKFTNPMNDEIGVAFYVFENDPNSDNYDYLVDQLEKAYALETEIKEAESLVKKSVEGYSKYIDSEDFFDEWVESPFFYEDTSPESEE